MYPSKDTLKNIIHHPNTIFINESGLYQILSNSTKPIASKFRDELFIDILPTICKTGMYKLKFDKIDTHICK